MGWFTDALSAIDKPSNALQGLAVDGLSGVKRGWNQEENYDFEQVWGEDLSKKGWSEREGLGETSSYIASTLLNLVVDPLNALPVGMIYKGMKGIKSASKAGADTQKGAMKGLLTSSFPNYIPNYYGLNPSKKQIQEGLKKGYFSDKIGMQTPLITQADSVVKDFGVDKGGYRAAQKVGGFATVAKEGIKNFSRTVMDPEAMALYRGEGINKNMLTNQNILSPKDREIEQVHRLFYNAHIIEQSGRVGSKQILKDFNMNLGVNGYQPFTKGSYNELSSGYGGGTGTASKAENAFIENHIGTVWKDEGFTNKILNKVAGKDWKVASSVAGKLSKDGVPINKAKGKTKIFIKRGGLEDKGRTGGRSGQHYDDITLRSKTFSDIAEAIGQSKPNSLEELQDLLMKGNYREGIPSFKIDKETGNVWANFGKTGTSITEGGVNALVGIKPNGKFILTVSDEHNFLENLPVVGAVLKKTLPNRLLVVTPPYINDFAKYKYKIMGVPKPKNAIENAVPIESVGNRGTSWGEEIRKVTMKEATPANILYEQGRLSRRKGIAGMFSASLLSNDSSSR